MTMIIRRSPSASHAPVRSGGGIPTTSQHAGGPSGRPALNGFGALRESRAITRTAAWLAGDCHPWLEDTTAGGPSANKIATLTTGPLVAGIDGVSTDEASVADATLQHLNAPVREIDCRLSKILRTCGVRYVGELCQKTEVDLREAGVSRSSLTKIQKWLAHRGLVLGMNIPNWHQSSPVVPSDLTINGSDPRLVVSLDEFDLPVRIINMIYKLGIRNLGELCTKTANDFRAVKHCGPETIIEIQEALAEQGLSLGMTIHGE